MILFFNDDDMMFCVCVDMCTKSDARLGPVVSLPCDFTVECEDANPHHGCKCVFHHCTC